MANIDALLLRPDSRAERITIDNHDLKAYQELIGGYLEPITSPHFVAYVDEDGHVHGRQENLLATAWISVHVRPLLQPIVGTCIIVGPTKGGYDTSLPECYFEGVNLGS